MKSARVVDPPSEYLGTPCDWALRSEPDERWLKLYRDEVAYLGAAAVSLAALRYLPHKHDAYFGGHDRWRQLAGVSESTLQRHVQILDEKGYIVRDGRQGPRVHRYLLSRAEPKTKDDNDAFAVMPIGFLARVKNFNERVVFSIVISSLRQAEGIIEKIHPGMVAGEEEFLFANFIRWHEFHPSPGRSGLFGLVAKDVRKWGLSERGYQIAKKQLRKNGLIEVYGSDETFVVPSGRTDQFEEIASNL